MPLGKPNRSPVERLKGYRKKYSKLKGGFRGGVRSLSCETYRAAIEIQKKRDHRRDFFDLIPIAGPNRKNKIIFEAMAFMMKAKVGTPRKIAWKRARAIQFLHESGVGLDSLEEELKKRRGLEAVAREAARADPRRTSKRPNKKDEFDDDPDNLDDDSGEILDDGKAPERDEQPANDRLTTLVLHIRSSDRAQIEDSAPGTKLALDVVRSSRGGPLGTVLSATAV